MIKQFPAILLLFFFFFPLTFSLIADTLHLNVSSFNPLHKDRLHRFSGFGELSSVHTLLLHRPFICSLWANPPTAICHRQVFQGTVRPSPPPPLHTTPFPRFTPRALFPGNREPGSASDWKRAARRGCGRGERRQLLVGSRG